MKLKELIRIIRASKKNRFVYHFTDEANLPNIRKYGILSKAKQDEQKVFATHPGGDGNSRVSDKLNGIYGDVSLCLAKGNPMAYRCREDGRHPKQVFLHIDPMVLRLPGVRLSQGMANTYNAKIEPISNSLDSIDVEILYHSVFVNDFKSRISAAEKFEILIPDSVPVEYIRGKTEMWK